MKILALDVATKTGWCNNTSSGVWDFKLKRDESSGMRLIRFKAKLAEICKLERPDLVVFEQTAGRFRGALIVQAEIHGVMKNFLDDQGIAYRSFAATAIKKHATGKGNAGKPLMMAACREKLGIEPIDDNHADACWIYDMARVDLDLGVKKN
ncbi:MAG: hypothetical protein HRT88_07185 [Lentisphaeraceae bacterium]|nr:hypothetical protein [Lentisphaeraceae bacterium]